MMDMTNVDRRRSYTVVAGPYKGIIGCKVRPVDVRGSAGMVYLENMKDGLVYEVSPKHVKSMKEVVFGK